MSWNGFPVVSSDIYVMLSTMPLKVEACIFKLFYKVSMLHVYYTSDDHIIHIKYTFVNEAIHIIYTLWTSAFVFHGEGVNAV